MGVTISTGVHPGGLNIWLGAPRCREERKCDWGAGKKSIELLGCCCTAGDTAGMVGWLQNFSAVALTFLKILWECRILIENAMGLRKSVSLATPGAPRYTPARAGGQRVVPLIRPLYDLVFPQIHFFYKSNLTLVSPKCCLFFHNFDA